jgi:DNA-binding FadR family transcriptional regulator
MLKHLNALRQDFVHRSERAEIRTNDPASSGQTGRVLSRRIRHDIAKMNWPIDHNLGSEAELLQRYGTGRGTLREAVRLLEHHAAVEMRRGPGGGLIVRAPDGESVIHAVALHLTYRGIRAADLFEAREALEMAALQLAIERLTEEGTDRLTRALDGNGSSSVGFAQSAHDFHVLIAELGGNRTLQLFVAVLARITAERLEEPGVQRGATPGNTLEQVSYAHRRIVDAILDGDVALARRRMRIHLRSLERAIA